MKKNIFIAIIAAAASLTSCADFLEEAPVLSQSDVLTLSTYRGLDKAVAGAYAPLSSTGWYMGDFLFINEMKTVNGQKFMGGDWDTGRMTDWYKINYSSSKTSGIWSSAYFIIKSVNDVMDNLEGKGDEQDLNNLKAECLFLRAFCHFDLVRTYAQPFIQKKGATPGVPIILHSDPDGKPARNTVAEVYDQIIADLEEAKSIIDPAYSRAGVTDKKAVVNIDVINAMLSRVYLYHQDWQKAADAATEVINSKHYALWTAEDMAEAECYRQNVGGSEVIFEIYSNTSNSYGGGNESITYLTNPEGYGDATCPDDIHAQLGYEQKDARGGLFYTDAKETHLWTAKYYGKGVGKPDYANVIIFRLSEMYLTRAEALTNGASVEGATAVSDLAAVATRCGATPGTGLAGIYAERAKEFCWEGHLWFDLGRTGRAMERADKNDGCPATVAAGSKEWAMPLPEREFAVNPNLVQNEGY